MQWFLSDFNNLSKDKFTMTTTDLDLRENKANVTTAGRKEHTSYNTSFRPITSI
jgi:hypothetical protein